MSKTLGDLNQYLFKQLERLDEETEMEKLDSEIRRSHAIAGIAKNIINNGNLVLRAKERMVDRLDADEELPKMLKGE